MMISLILHNSQLQRPCFFEALCRRIYLFLFHHIVLNLLSVYSVQFADVCLEQPQLAWFNAHLVHFDHLPDQARWNVGQFTQAFLVNPQVFGVGFYEALCGLLAGRFVARVVFALQVEVQGLLLAVDAVAVGERALDVAVELGVGPALVLLTFLFLEGFYHLRVVCKISLF